MLCAAIIRMFASLALCDMCPASFFCQLNANDISSLIENQNFNAKSFVSFILVDKMLLKHGEQGGRGGHSVFRLAEVNTDSLDCFRGCF